MTIHRAHYLSRVCLPVLLSGLSLLLVLAVNARASSPWGESAHVALAAATKAGETGIDVERHSPLAFAGNPADGDFYVADVVEEGAKPKFRLQLFGREGTHRGSVEFATPETAKSQTESSAVELQLAVDPARNRVYVLVVYTRRGVTEGEENELSKEETRLEKEGKKCERHISCFERFPLDSEERVAGEIYAFDYNGSELLPAKLKEGVAVPITTQGGLAAQGETPKEALLDPRGMAVEPGTGNLLITGQEDEQENLKVEKEEGSRQCRAVAQFVSVKESKGELTGKLGTRYVDDEQKLRELTCELGESESVPYSPIVTAGGKVFAEESHAEGGEIWELPESTEKATGAKIEVKGEEVPQLITKPRLAYALDPKQTLLSFGAEGTSGPLMSFVPEAGGAGRIYLMAEIAGQKGELANAGVLALDYSEAGAQPEISELGWTGGGYEESGKREGCVIPRASEQAVLIDGFKETGGSGKEGVVAFDVYEHESAPHADAIEFAPGGAAGECPHSTLTATVLHAKGVEVKQALPHEKVTFSSIEEVADVESVEWKFENLSTKKSEAPEAGQVEYSPTGVEVKVEHSFAEEGEYEVTEIVQPDNLASAPQVQKLIVSVGLVAPRFTIEGRSEIENGQSDAFAAKIVDGNEHPTPFHYVWKFGDGSEEAGTTESLELTAEHAYRTPCPGCEVTLEVTDKNGKVGKSSFVVAVARSKAEVQLEEEQLRAAKAAELARVKGEEEAKRKAEETAKRQAEEVAKRHAEEEAKRNPEAKLAAATVPVLASGALTLKVTCPSGESSCSGSVTLRTLGAVSTGAHKKRAVLTLASGSFDVVGGQVKAVSLKLSSAARALLAHSHTLKARVTLISRDPAGVQRTTVVVITLRASKAHTHKH